MRSIYRGLAVVAAVAVGATVIVLALPSGPDEVVAGPVTAPPAAPASSAPAPTTSATPTPTSPPTPAPTPIPSPGASLAPGYTAMQALYADPRVPRLTGRVKRMALPRPAKLVVKDKRTGLAVPRLGKPWKTHGAAPFTSKQVLPAAGGGKLRGMLVTCPLPIMEQKSPRDTALLAARWTLNHHPKGSKISWLASQRVKTGWMLVFRVKYGKHSSRAAVVVMDGGMSKPGLAFVTVPDSQRKRWRDIGRVVSGVRVLG
ncbi:hypothetical protein [Nonomuraea sp. NPDC052265]|uniref:hypothetical protein n=1 Tax=Nonomuraea sp. NPDC052265 TaxID=3364374 RepID=UPI0037C92AFA